MAAIASTYRTDLERLVRELRRAARTIRAGTLAERDATRRMLVAAVQHDLEPQARVDEHGLEALHLWTSTLQSADVSDVDLLQELLYGIDALVRVHLWRETGLPLTPPEPRSASDV
jgi:CBS-domain-containing membrane protein